MKKRFLKIVLPLVLLLAGAGGAAWYFFLGDGQKLWQMVEEKVFSHERGYLEFKPFVISVLQGSEVTHHVTVRLVVELKDERDLELAEALKPRLKDQYLYELQGLYAMRLVLDQGFDMPLVHERIRAVSDRVLGHEIVTGIDVTISNRRLPPNS
jgi:flagellar basal body-associated protein FliL